MRNTFHTSKKISTVAICSLSIATLALAQDEKPQRPGGGKGGGEFLKQIDKDGDGNISKEEAGERWERMSRLDKDSDGVITKTEMAAMRGGGKSGPEGGKGGPEGEKGGKGKGGAGMFERSDKNGDGKLTQDEVPEQAWARVASADKNEDGAVTKEEIMAHMRGMGGKGGKGGPEGEKGRPGGGNPSAMFDRFDKNSDGKLTSDEVPEQIWGRLSQADKDGDGAIAKAEMPTMGGGKGGPGGKGGKGGAGGMGAMLEKLDKNADGKLGEDEVPAEMWARLRNADSDADGLVSKEELGKLGGGGERKKGDSDSPKPEGKKRPDFES